MKNTTLCYIENPQGEYLMLHRVKKENDLNHDKWIGVGGKCEEGESPEECICRETLEEDGADPDGLPLPGCYHLCVRRVGGGVHAPIHRHRLDRGHPRVQ